MGAAMGNLVPQTGEQVKTIGSLAERLAFTTSIPELLVLTTTMCEIVQNGEVPDEITKKLDGLPSSLYPLPAFRQRCLELIGANFVLHRPANSQNFDTETESARRTGLMEIMLTGLHRGGLDPRHAGQVLASEISEVVLGMYRQRKDHLAAQLGEILLYETGLEPLVQQSSLDLIAQQRVQSHSNQ
jgi:hypothetical protein